MANEKRLIDCEQAKRATYEEIFWTESEQAVVRNFLAKLPKVDAVEVVRCKDCEHWMPGDSFMGDSVDDMQRVGGCPYVRFRRLENDFCSYGERKDNERKAD